MKHLILLHGALGFSGQFDSLKNHFSKDFEVHTLNFYGHGGEKPVHEMTVSVLVEQLQGFLTEHTISEAHVFGYSLGGYVALSHALEFPGMIKSVLTLGTKFDWSPEQAEKEIKMLDPDIISAKVPAFARQLEVIHGAETWKKLLKETAHLMLDLGKKPVLNPGTFARLSLPVQIMVGDRDATAGVEGSLNAFREIPEARLAVLPDTKHPFEKASEPLLIQLAALFWKKTGILNAC